MHGAVGVGDESDGYAEAWYLPDAVDIPSGFARVGTWYEFFAEKAAAKFGVSWQPGSATFQYPNEQRAATLWYHDHALGMTRLNVYAGPAGFYILRGGPAGDEAVTDIRTGARAVLPGPAPREGDRFPPNKRYREIALAIQDRSFHEDGSLFYPDTRAFFDGISGPYVGADGSEHGAFSPIWNPEFFGNVIVVNGASWPYLTVEQRRYRFRILNGCQSRFLVLDWSSVPGAEAWQIGNEGGFLPEPVDLTELGGHMLLGPAERADVIVDFASVRPGRYVLRNLGPDEPFGGGWPGIDFEPADPETTGQVLELRVVPSEEVDDTTPPRFLKLPRIEPLPEPTVTRQLALVERMGTGYDAAGNETEGPLAALLGNIVDGVAVERLWMDEVTENPAVGATEVWEFVNTTGDAHPIHIHEVVFEVVNREGLVLDDQGEVVQHRADRRRLAAGALGARAQGHSDRLPGAGDAGQGALRDARPVRLALPHRRARGQRDDAAIPNRSRAAGPAGPVVRPRSVRPRAARPRCRASREDGPGARRAIARARRCAPSLRTSRPRPPAGREARRSSRPRNEPAAVPGGRPRADARSSRSRPSCSCR